MIIERDYKSFNLELVEGEIEIQMESSDGASTDLCVMRFSRDEARQIHDTLGRLLDGKSE